MLIACGAAQCFFTSAGFAADFAAACVAAGCVFALAAAGFFGLLVIVSILPPMSSPPGRTATSGVSAAASFGSGGDDPCLATAIPIFFSFTLNAV